MKAAQIRARLLEIQNRVTEIQNGDLDDAAMTEIETLNAEFGDLEKKLEAADKAEEMLAKMNASAGRKTQPAPTNTPKVEVVDSKAKFGGFNSTGDFIMAVRRAASGQIDERLKNTAYEKIGEDGGYLVPEEMSSEILKKLESNESLLASTTQLKTGGNGMTLNLDESQPWNQGVQAYWVAEGETITESKPKFTQASWRLHKVGVLVKPTEELLEDATALESYIRAAAPSAIMYKINGAVISGNGVGKPEGLLASPFTVSVAKESGQAADTIVAKNIIKMYARMIPSARAGAKWYINAGAEEQLLGLKDDNGNFIYLAPGSQMNQSPYGLLLGRPVIPMMSGLPALGDSGDIVFANLSYYYSLVKAGGIKSATSIHMEFAKDIVAFKFTMRVDGKVPFKSPVTTEFGNYQMSAFVKLDDRA